jgi:hypothetical protein
VFLLKSGLHRRANGMKGNLNMAGFKVEVTLRAFTTHYTDAEGRPTMSPALSMPKVIADLLGDDLTQSRMALDWLRHNVRRHVVITP